MVGLKKRRLVAQSLASRANSKYGEMKRRKIRAALDQLVLGMLWCHTSTRRATRSLRALNRAFVDWNEVRISPVAEVASVISTAEWSVLSAERLIAVLKSLFEARNTISLDFLSEFTTTQARTFLQGLPGVARYVADEVLLFSLQVEILPLSEEAARMCYRMGLIRTHRPTMDNQRSLMQLWDPNVYPGLVLLLGDCATMFCQQSDPRCEGCPVKLSCTQTGL